MKYLGPGTAVAVDVNNSGQVLYVSAYSETTLLGANLNNPVAVQRHVRWKPRLFLGPPGDGGIIASAAGNLWDLLQKLRLAFARMALPPAAQ